MVFFKYFTKITVVNGNRKWYFNLFCEYGWQGNGAYPATDGL